MIQLKKSAENHGDKDDWAPNWELTNIHRVKFQFVSQAGVMNGGKLLRLCQNIKRCITSVVASFGFFIFSFIYHFFPSLLQAWKVQIVWFYLCVQNSKTENKFFLFGLAGPVVTSASSIHIILTSMGLSDCRYISAIADCLLWSRRVGCVGVFCLANGNRRSQPEQPIASSRGAKVIKETYR